MNKTIKKLIHIIEGAQVYHIGTYKYFIFPFKGISPIDTDLLNNVVKLMNKKISKKCSKLVTIMVDGIVTALPMAILLKKPLIIAKDFHYNLNNVGKFVQETEYFKRDMYFSGIESSDNIDIVDCIISSGGTIINFIKALEKIGCKINGIHSIVDKSEYGGSKILKKLGYNVHSLVDLKIESNKVICKSLID